jgi:DNA-binding CsgD family transcriptional regulator
MADALRVPTRAPGTDVNPPGSCAAACTPIGRQNGGAGGVGDQQTDNRPNAERPPLPRPVRELIQAAICYNTIHDRALAEVLGLAPSAVHSNWGPAFELLGVHERFAAIRKAVALRLVACSGPEETPDCPIGRRCRQLWVAPSPLAG